MAEYNGTIELISGITPKNNGTFPLVNAEDVLMPDGTRLNQLKPYNADTREQIQQLLDERKPVRVTKANIPVEKSIVINNVLAYLEFAPGASLKIVADEYGHVNHPAITIARTDAGKKPGGVRILNPVIVGSWNKDSDEHSVGIRIEALGYNNHINNVDIQHCEYGIQYSGVYDCGQQNAIYEPYICNCRNGINDRVGGMQNTRVYGGRIENNREWGIVTASKNMRFEGTLIQGNDIGEVKLLNVYVDRTDLQETTNGVSNIESSGGSFINCYFEHANREDENGNVISDCIFQLGDGTEYKMILNEDGEKVAAVIADEDGDDIERQANGWHGNLNLIGCGLVYYGNPILRSFGRGALVPGMEESRNQRIQIIGCSASGQQMFDIPKFDDSCSLAIQSLTRGPRDANEKLIPLETGVGEGVNMTYVNNNQTRLGTIRAKSISGTDSLNAPLDFVKARELHLERYDYETYTQEEADADTTGQIEAGALKVDSNGNYIPKDGYGQWLEFTHSMVVPWMHKDAATGKTLTGLPPGSLHFCSTNRTWYQRTKWIANGVDAEDRWVALVLKSDLPDLSSYVTKDYVDTSIESIDGGLTRIQGEDFRLDRYNVSNQWITFTHSATLPWEHKDENENYLTGRIVGSLHYHNTGSASTSRWYQRIRSMTKVTSTVPETYVDDSSKWSELIIAADLSAIDNSRIKTDTLLLDRYGEDDQYLGVTHSTTLPWEHKDESGNHLTGLAPGSLHYYCAASSTNRAWYQRTGWIQNGVDAEDRWVKLAIASDLPDLSNYATKEYVDTSIGELDYTNEQYVDDAIGKLGVVSQYSDMDYVADQTYYIEKQGYPHIMSNSSAAKYCTHRYAVTASKTYRIHGSEVSFVADYPLALFTQTTETGNTNIGTIIVTGSTDKVDYEVTFTPETDGYIWIATHISHNHLTVEELVYNEVSGILLRSSTPGSSKKFMLTVDDDGRISNTYTREEIDSMFGSYITDVAALVGGDA